jgi:hypothetical protein
MFVIDALKTIENYNTRTINGEKYETFNRNSLHENLNDTRKDAGIAGSIQKLFFY